MKRKNEFLFEIRNLFFFFCSHVNDDLCFFGAKWRFTKRTKLSELILIKKTEFWMNSLARWCILNMHFRILFHSGLHPSNILNTFQYSSFVHTNHFIVFEIWRLKKKIIMCVSVSVCPEPLKLFWMHYLKWILFIIEFVFLSFLFHRNFLHINSTTIILFRFFFYIHHKKIYLFFLCVYYWIFNVHALCSVCCDIPPETQFLFSFLFFFLC